MPIWSIWQFPRGTPEGTQDPSGVGFRLFGDRGSSGQVGPQHPFLLLETAGDLDVDILRRKVLFAPVNTAANLRDRHARTVNERLQEETFPMFVKRERRKRRFLHRPLDRPVRRAVQLNRAFRHEIGEFSRLVREAVEQLMKLGESRALRSEEHTSELQSPCNLVCRLLLEKKKKLK